MNEFVSEGGEIIQRVSGGLQLIEKGASDPEILGAVYRDMHTLKGTAQLFGFQNVGRVAHAMEACLDPIRKQKIGLSPRLMERCLKSLDLLDRMLKSIQSGNPDSEFQKEMIETVSLLVDAATHQFNAEIRITNDSPVTGETHSKQTPPETAGQPEPATSPEKPPLKTEETQTTPNEPSQSQNPSAAPADTTIRVQVTLLDRLMNLVGELVLVRNQFLQYRNAHEDLEFMSMSKSLDVVTSDLQSEVMKTRMQPIGSVVSKFQRVVRDISRDLSKKIDLTLEGSETELDKTLLEAIKDPLTHLVRNSCDHGIETPEERKKANKPESGHVLIRSFHEGGQVVVEISDDGKGLDRDRILAKGIERGLVTQEQAGRIQDREIWNMIFLPGFSTAKQVTSVSGRGVGMDVVKTNIEKIGGTVELSSILGKGTTIRLKIPLTLAIVPAMLVRSGSEKFAIPQVKLVELVRVDGAESSNRIEYLQGRPMYRLRGSLLPLIDIREIIGDSVTGKYNEGTNIVVLNAEGDYFGLIVDEILDTADIVVKPLSSFLKYLSVFSGATILGDGSIALILDVIGMANAGRIDTKKGDAEDQALHLGGAGQQVNLDAQEFLLFNLGTSVVHAIPLCLVHRLEEFPVKDIEFSGEQRVVRYRGSLLPILHLAQLLGYDETGATRNLEKSAVVVIQRSGRSFGIEVSEILDVVTIEDQIDDTIRDREGILGNIIFNSSVIAVVDALGVIEQAVPALRRNTGRTDSSTPDSALPALEDIRLRNRDMKSKKIRILFAEDVAFFRRHVSKVLTDAGFAVTTVEDGAKALETLENAPKGEYNLVLSDIEMPKMTGLDLAREIRKRDQFKSIPMIALTTRFKDKDVQEGKQAGFDLYLEKLNPEKLLSSIDVVMKSSVE